MIWNRREIYEYEKKRIARLCIHDHCGMKWQMILNEQLTFHQKMLFIESRLNHGVRCASLASSHSRIINCHCIYAAVVFSFAAAICVWRAFAGVTGWCWQAKFRVGTSTIVDRTCVTHLSGAL